MVLINRNIYSIIKIETNFCSIFEYVSLRILFQVSFRVEYLRFRQLSNLHLVNLLIPNELP